MADRLKSSRCFSSYSCVHIILVLISASLAKGIAEEVVFPDQYSSRFPPAYQNSTSALGNRRRTSRWRTPDPGHIRLTTLATSTALHDEQLKLLSNAALVPVTSFGGNGPVSSAAIRSPQSGDVAQQSWTIRPRSRTTADLNDAPKTSGPRWTSRVLPVGSENPVELGRQWKTSPDALTIAEDDKETLPASLARTTIASDSDYSKTSQEMQEDGDYVSDYSEDEDDEDGDDGGDDDSDEEDYDDYDDDDDEEEDDDNKNEFYNYDEDYEDNDNGRHQDSDGYEGTEYSDESDGVDSGHRYAKEGNMRMPVNYTDPGSREHRRLVINGKSSTHIDVSLLIIYAWLGLVIVMIAITVLIFKYKQQLSTRCLKVTSSCRKVRQAIGIEEGNNLLAHPLV